MAYYSVSFSYPGPTASDPDSDDGEASRANFAAEKVVIEKLNSAGFNQRHAYSWPDGSLYKYIKSDLDIDDLSRALSKLFPAADYDAVRFRNASECKPDTNPWKYDCDTLEEYFNHADK